MSYPISVALSTVKIRSRACEASDRKRAAAALIEWPECQRGLCRPSLRFLELQNEGYRRQKEPARRRTIGSLEVPDFWLVTDYTWLRLISGSFSCGLYAQRTAREHGVDRACRPQVAADEMNVTHFHPADVLQSCLLYDLP
jgi:hypothetical protein